MKKYFLVSALLVHMVVFSQMDQYQFYSGMSMYSRNEALDLRGVDKNAFANFQPSPIIGAGFSMFLNDNTRIGANFEGTTTSKQFHKMSTFSILPTLNFHIVPFDKKVSPFFTLSANITFLNLSRSEYVYVAVPDERYSVADPRNPPIVREEISRPYFNMQSQPIFGGMVGLGVDLKIMKHMGLILCGNYNILLDETNPTINQNLTNNNYNLSYIQGNLMLRYRIF